MSNIYAPINNLADIRDSMKEKYSYVAIAAMIPDPYAKRLAEVSARLASDFVSWYVLDLVKFPPHVTVWIAHVPTRNMREIGKRASELCRGRGRLRITIRGIKIEPGGHVSLMVERTKRLERLHEQLLSGLNEFREGYLEEKYRENLESYPRSQQRSLQEYGTRFAGKLFRPHATVSVVNASKLDEVRKYLKEREWKWRFDVRELTMFRRVETGRSVEILGVFPLGRG